jgi:N-acetylglucosaminylphosphatidylinositol deacetylase
VKKWNIDAVRTRISSALIWSLNINSRVDTNWQIITFDSGGVSGHINHRAVSAAIQAYASDPAAPAAYMVTTTMLLRKYTFLGDLPLTTLPFTWRIITAIFFPARAGSSAAADHGYGAQGLVANSWYRYMKTREAFRSHNSQYSWDRHLYMVLSRYVWFNDLVAVPKQARQVK